MDIKAAREHYRTVLTTLSAERSKRDRYLGEPRRSAALKEVDAAIASLGELGKVLQAASQAGILEQVVEQAPLFELPNPPHYP